VVQTGREDSDYFISVKDNGIGIEKKYIKNIFKKFYRVPTGDVHDVKGFGLGLNFVKRIIDGHDGKIRVNSLPGIGTEFRLLLPFH
jgi:two-component system phosphate regulon sensor histidine kinase PhoR